MTWGTTPATGSSKGPRKVAAMPYAPTREAELTAEEALIHVLWINAGLSCDGDSVALTAATQPSIEEIALGALPGLPKVAVHWPLIDFECGPNAGADDFLEWFFKADRGELEPFVLVIEGSIPNEAIKSEGYWCGFGNNPATGQPMTTSEWIDRLAVRHHRARGLRPGRVLRAGRLRHRVRVAQVPGQDRLLGAGGQVQRAQAGLAERHRRLPQRRRHLHRLHHAPVPGQVHAVHGRATRQQGLDRGQRHVRDGDPKPAQRDRQDRGQGAEVAQDRPRADHRLPPELVGEGRR